MQREGKKLAQVARCQARGLLDLPGSDQHHEQAQAVDASLAAWGLCLAPDPDDDDDGAAAPEEPKCCLWPCNVAAFNAWQRVQTQWRTDAAGGRTGLDYAGVIAYLVDVLRIKPQARAELLGGLQAMEWAALEIWREQRD